jgi:hypothetical protein
MYNILFGRKVPVELKNHLKWSLNSCFIKNKPLTLNRARGFASYSGAGSPEQHHLPGGREVVHRRRVQVQTGGHPF